MRTILLTLLLLALAGCHLGPRIAYSPARGSSLQNPVVITGTADYDQLEKAEKVWITKKYPGSRIERRSIRGIDGRHYSIVEIATTEAGSRTVYFEITDYFSHQ